MHVNWLQKVIGKEWNITPAGGLTGDAYIAERQDRRIFLKRNSSPFLAVLSAEGIVPKLMWTKRLENGDVLTAQEWLEGRELKPEEMQHHHVANLLNRIHQSSELLHMLMRMGKKAVTSDATYRDVAAWSRQNGLLDQYEEVGRALQVLKELLPATYHQELVVCHCDLNHNNLILTEHGDLYLVDWDNAMIADPAMDFGMVLKWYVPMNDWDAWLEQYGVERNDSLVKRMYWYLIADALHYINWHKTRNEWHKVDERLGTLRELLNTYQSHCY
ncbi:phosphotransferase family protein [Lentibacillus saliphilus]|uniref:phosphotransferase family protein n=1 Tax=Lentibacillus saliphilus TaxID=2737028 RepID=UPI001C2F16DF|nr:phosphotransferase family protein [Lentibacillus saliphilus]